MFLSSGTSLPMGLYDSSVDNDHAVLVWDQKLALGLGECREFPAGHLHSGILPHFWVLFF